MEIQSDVPGQNYFAPKLLIGRQQMPCDIFQIFDSWSEQFHAFWSTCFMVEDTRKSSQQAVELGADIVMPATATLAGTFASLKDP